MGTATHVPVFKRMLGPTRTIEPVVPELTLRSAVPSDTDGELVALLSSARTGHVAGSAAASTCCRACGPGTGYDRPAIG